MFERLLARLAAAKPDRLPKDDAALALGALLIRVAKADRAYLFEEIATIDRILAQRHDLNPVEAAKLRARCEALEEEMPHSGEVSATIRAVTSDEDREATVEALWRVALADQISHEAEVELVALVEVELGVSPETGARLREDAARCLRENPPH